MNQEKHSREVSTALERVMDLRVMEKFRGHLRNVLFFGSRRSEVLYQRHDFLSGR
jgi:hypothetical protein